MPVHFSNPQISQATETDIPAICRLLNMAYRGESSRKGWTTEADLIGGDQRTTEPQLAEFMQIPGSVFLKYETVPGQVDGCVNLQLHGNRIYLGMFSVNPDMQGSGIGKKILKAAEEFAGKLQAVSIYMSVISVRKELIDWYQRQRYADTGERKPFHEDGITGNHLRPLEFMMLEKSMLAK
ncbi:MAG: GNAT family N-acetyltransferase [Chitinophagaceae bacterium]|nr:GNAT family N-acetyltransferase [Chitinophagaceae bacterium]